MTPHAANRLEKASRFLAQMELQSPENAPEATIHLAYYAMLHAASAVLLERTGDAPKTHSATIGQFSQLVIGDAERGRKYGRALNEAEKLRLVSDYQDRVIPTVMEAADLKAKATDFVTYCRSLLR